MRIQVGSLAFEVHEGGPEDGPPVVLLHGFPQHSGEWDALTPALHAVRLRTYAVDQRGYSPGARPADPEAYRMALCVADVLSIMDALGVHDAHLIGHDWGAVVAWHLAARHPARVRSLTAISVPHPLALSRALEIDPDQRERSAYIRFFRQPGKAEEVLLADGARRLRGMLAGVPADRADLYVRPLLAPDALTAALNWYRAASRADLEGLGPVPVPTTYVWSDRDLAIGRTAAQGCADHVSGDYQFVPLAGVSHWIPDEAPEKLGAAALARIGSLAR